MESELNRIKKAHETVVRKLEDLGVDIIPLELDDIDWTVRDGRPYCPECDVVLTQVLEKPLIYQCDYCNGVFDEFQIVE